MKKSIPLVIVTSVITFGATLFFLGVFQAPKNAPPKIANEGALHMASPEVVSFAAKNQMDMKDKAPAAFHEFVMFGNDKIYLSHYTMFHAVHSYQAIIQVSFKKDNVDVTKAFLEDRHQNPDREYSVSPAKKGSPSERRRDDWILPDYMHEGTEFNADIHWGEEENELLFRDVTVHIDKVVFFRQFEENDQRDNQLTYILFGDKGDRYLAHYISGIPNFDHIVAVDVIEDTFGTDPNITLTFDKNNDPADRLEGDVEEYTGVAGQLDTQQATEANSELGKPFSIKFKAEAYFEEIEEQG